MKRNRQVVYCDVLDNYYILPKWRNRIDILGLYDKVSLTPQSVIRIDILGLYDKVSLTAQSVIKKTPSLLLIPFGVIHGQPSQLPPFDRLLCLHPALTTPSGMWSPSPQVYLL